MFRKSYVRGVNKALMATGAVKYASEELAAEAADSVADVLPEQPVDEMAPENTAEIATTLVDLSNKLEEASQAAAGAAEGIAGGEMDGAEGMDELPPEALAAAMSGGAGDPAEKEASLKNAAAFLRNKLANNPTGSTITGTKPEQQNTQPLSENAESIMDLANRPEGYANVGEDGVGTQEASGVGASGEEQVVQGVGMGPVGKDGSNAATEATTKVSNLRNLIKKVAMGTGSTITGTKPEQKNTPEQAAQVTGEGAMEATERPVNYAVKGEDAVGQSDMAEKIRASAVGTESAHPGTMGPVGQPGSNTAIQQTAGTGATGKTAEDEEWLSRFKATSAKYAHVLPFWMDNNEKVAAVQYFMGLSPSEASSTAGYIQKTAEIPEALKEYVEKKKDGGKEKKEDGDKKEKKDKKEDDEGTEKEASLQAGDIVSRLRSLHA